MKKHSILKIILYWNQQKKEKSNYKLEQEKLYRIISSGEGKTTEFKSSLRWCMTSNKVQPYIEAAVVKTISGFMNKKGGILLIGVEDDGNIIGLDLDYATFKKENKDNFSQHLSNILERDIGIQFSNYWKEKFIEIDNKEICIIEVSKSLKPVFTRVNNEEKFFVRSGSTTKSLKPSNLHEYIEMNF